MEFFACQGVHTDACSCRSGQIRAGYALAVAEAESKSGSTMLSAVSPLLKGFIPLFVVFLNPQELVLPKDS
jgi:hypothetical protein